MMCFRVVLMLIVAAICAAGMSPRAFANPAGKAKAIAACNMCHGEAGISNLPNAPHLGGQPEIYLIEQLKAMRSGKRPSETMSFIAKPLTDAEIKDLASWYSSMELKVTVKAP
jgi:cytochrome c553